MGDPTPNLDLARPDEGNTNWAGPINSNWAKIDAACGGNNCYCETGDYTGDGTTGQTITLTDSSLVIKYLRIYRVKTSSGDDLSVFATTDLMIGQHVDGMCARGGPEISQLYPRSKANSIASIGTGSFVVDDAGGDDHPNKNGRTYTFLVIGTH